MQSLFPPTGSSYSSAIQTAAVLPHLNSQVNATSREEIQSLMGNFPYDEHRTPSQNLIRFLIENPLSFPTTDIILIQGLNFSFEGESVQELTMPKNLKLRNCYLV